MASSSATIDFRCRSTGLLQRSNNLSSKDPWSASSRDNNYAWTVPGWQSFEPQHYSDIHTTYDASSWTGMLPSYDDKTQSSGLFPPSFLPELTFPPSPSDTGSSISIDTPIYAPQEPQYESLLVICDVPVIAPRPLPYHSPTFLQFELPDSDEDLSHPPYTTRPSKRKRDYVDDDGENDCPPEKRRTVTVSNTDYTKSPASSHRRTIADPYSFGYPPTPRKCLRIPQQGNMRR